jgi:hypothetical protein
VAVAEVKYVSASIFSFLLKNSISPFLSWNCPEEITMFIWLTEVLSFLADT